MDGRLSFYGKKEGDQEWTLFGDPVAVELPKELYVGPAVSTEAGTLQRYTVTDLILKKLQKGTRILLR